jgi:hypothetical protein
MFDLVYSLRIAEISEQTLLWLWILLLWTNRSGSVLPHSMCRAIWYLVMSGIVQYLWGHPLWKGRWSLRLKVGLVIIWYCPVKRSQSAENFYTCRDCNNYTGRCEVGSGINVYSNGKHVMSSYSESQKTSGHYSSYYSYVSSDSFLPEY